MNNTLSRERMLELLGVNVAVIKKLNEGLLTNILWAMDEYAKQECIEFMKWKGESDWCEWGGFFVNATTEETITHDDLFDKYLLHKQNKEQ